MDFIVSSGGLLKNLQLVGGIISTNVVVPILENFLFELEGNKLIVTGGDMETMIKAGIEVQQAEGEDASGANISRICVPSKIFLEYLKNLPEQPLHIKVTEGFSIEISSNSGKYKIGGEDAIEYPKEAESKDLTSFSMPSNQLTEAITKTIFAISADNLRPAMTGVFFEMTEAEGINFVSTDGHRLVKLTRSDVSCPTEGGIIIPHKPLQHLKNILPTDESVLQLSYNNTHFFVENEQIKLNCRLIDGKYPPYRAVIPNSSPYTLTVNRADLISCLRRVSIFASKSTQQVVFDIKGNTVNISGQDVDFSFEGNETLTCQYNGEDMLIGFNGKFLIEILSNLKSEDVCLELSTPSKAGIFKPAEKEDDKDILMLLMPLMVGIENRSEANVNAGENAD